ncbi:hypothetical protein ISR94_00130 [Candidatus Microgenomates bacterium]|nr:hypothetical protein [Candidatus Microgenomates bacterium]
MGKTKTAVIGNIKLDSEKSSKELYSEKKARQKEEMEKVPKVQKEEKSTEKGVKVVTSDIPEVETVTETKETPKHESKRIRPGRGKKYSNAKASIDKTKLYPIKEAIEEIKKIVYSSFDETLEMHLVMKKTPTTASVTLPNSFGKGKKVEVADANTIEKLQNGKVDFDILLTTAEFMPKLVPYAKILGPRGLMPNPKNGTIIENKNDAAKFDANSLNLKTEKEAPLIHTAFGKVSMDSKLLVENAESILKALSGSKQIVRAFIKSTMGPSVKLSL